MAFAPDITANIRKNGSGRAWAAEVGADEPGEHMGHFGPGIDLSQNVTTEEETDYMDPGRGNIMSDVTETDPQIALVLREMSEFNLQIALMMGTWTDDNQIAGTMDSVSSAFTALRNYESLGFRNVFSTKVLHGVEAVANFQIDEIITGGSSGATGVIKWRIVDTYVEINTLAVSDFTVGETITGGTSGTTAVVASVQTNQDIIVCDADPGTVRYVNGTHYVYQPEPGFWASIEATPTSPIFISGDYAAQSRKFNYGLATTTVEKKITLVSNEADRGPTFELIFNKVSLALNGAITVIGDGIGLLNLTGRILADSSQPSGQTYYKLNYIY